MTEDWAELRRATVPCQKNCVTCDARWAGIRAIVERIAR